MTLQQLEYVLAVDRCKHFGRAADECRVSQPTLSAMVQKLETELGAKIFERTAHAVSTTELGKKIVAKARETLLAADSIRHIVAEERCEMGGTFRLGILPTIAPYLLPRFFPKLCATHPELDLRVTELKTVQLKQALADHKVDAAILVATGDLAGFDAETLYYEQFMAYVSRGDQLFDHSSIKTSDLVDEPLWLLDEGHCFRDQLVKFCNLKSARQSKRAYTLGSIETFMRMVESGQGVTFIPELALLQLTADQRQLVRPFAIPIPTREIQLLTAPGFVRYALRSLLAESVRKAVPKEMLKMNNTEQRI